MFLFGAHVPRLIAHVHKYSATHVCVAFGKNKTKAKTDDKRRKQAIRINKMWLRELMCGASQLFAAHNFWLYLRFVSRQYDPGMGALARAHTGQHTTIDSERERESEAKH